MTEMNENTPVQNPVTVEQPPVQPPSSSRHWFVIGIMAVALVGMIIVGLHSAKQPRNALVGNVAGKPAPDFELQDVNTGKTVHLSDYKGKAVVLNFWATWCPPCKAEIPWLVDFQKQYGADGLAVVSVAMDDASEQDIAKFSQEMSMNYPVLLGTEKVGDAYGGVDSLPTTFYIGRDGKLIERVEGLRSHREIETTIKTALAQRADQPGTPPPSSGQ